MRIKTSKTPNAVTQMIQQNNSDHKTYAKCVEGCAETIQDYCFCEGANSILLDMIMHVLIQLFECEPIRAPLQLCKFNDT